MATVTGVTLAKMQEIKNNTIVSARVENGILYFKKGDNSTEFNVGRIVLPAIAAWPVGSIFMSISPTNPKILLGVPSNDPATWVRWGQGRMPVSLDESQSEFDGVEEKGGAKTHRLTQEELPGLTFQAPYPNDAIVGITPGSQGILALSGERHTESTNTLGGGGEHNNLPPYITVYMWKRTV